MLIITSGYNANQVSNGRLRHWNDIELERNIKRHNARSEAEQKASLLGHSLKPWSIINSSCCTKCGREGKIINILSRDMTHFEGPLLHVECDGTQYNDSNDKWHYSMSTITE